jgi:ABC-type transport system involved in multi-copper enzyme maturation permease subunit
VDLALVLFGHLAGPECRRALARGWLIVARSVVGLALALALLFLLWFWWLNALFDASYAPGGPLEITLSISAIALLLIVVVQVPAMLAGSLAGERERGVLQLLLTTAVTPREIVTGRLLGKLSQVGMILLAGGPFLATLFAWNGFGSLQLGAFFLLLTAVGLGGGGLAVGASVVSRRGRDALLSVYSLMLLLVLSPLASWLGLPTAAAEWLLRFNPFFSMNRLVFDGETAPSLATSAFWVALGVGGTVVAAWRLRPSCLASGEVVKKSHRRVWVPALRERPMLWKELYIERVGTLGRFGRWLGALITVSIGGGSLILAAIIVADLFWKRETDLSSWATNALSVALSGAAGTFMGWLLQWAIGLRAAVSIASEREKGTWDALLMSPLTPGEIVRAKVFGSLHALRWMVGAMVLAWTLAVIVGAVSVGDYVDWIAANALFGALMAAIGVRCSLSLSTATRAMTWTIALWLTGIAVVACAAGSLIAIGWMLIIAVWSAAMQYGFVAFNSTPWFPITMGTAWPLANDLVTLLITILIVLDTSLRFDRIAGRMAGGAVATTVDQWLHGRPDQPVFLPSGKTSWTKMWKLTAKELPKPVPTVEIVAVE